MIDLIKKGMLAGVGAAVVTKESAEKALNDLVEKGKISTGEAKEVADKIVEDGRKEYEKVRSEMEGWFEDMLHKGKVATQTDIAKLEARIAKLEAAQKSGDE